MSGLHLCLDCGVDTAAIGELYMVRDWLWDWVLGPQRRGMMCIGCFERRLGRRLVPEDFTDAPLNWLPLQRDDRQSERLRDRMRTEA